jgi:hypothetical protein
MTDLQVSRETFELQGCSFTPTHLQVRDGMSFEEWQRLGDFIRLTNQASQWWWGDWLNAGDDAFGERSAQALESTRWEEETLRVYAWVCRKVPSVSRVTGVPFTHYRLLAKLSEAEQLEWATKVVDNQWSRHQLSAAIKEDVGSGIHLQPCVLVRCETDDQADAVEAWAAEQSYGADRSDRTRKS